MTPLIATLADRRVIDQVRALREAGSTIRRQKTGQVENQALQGESWNHLAAAYPRLGRKADAKRAVKNAEAAGFRVHPRLKGDIASLKPEL